MRDTERPARQGTSQTNAVAAKAASDLGKRATATYWGSSGRRFKSCQPDHEKWALTCGNRFYRSNHATVWPCWGPRAGTRLGPGRPLSIAGPTLTVGQVRRRVNWRLRRASCSAPPRHVGVLGGGRFPGRPPTSAACRSQCRYVGLTPLRRAVPRPDPGPVRPRFVRSGR